MSRYRVAVILILGLLVGLPLTLPFLEALTRPDALAAWREVPRFLLLGRNTLVLVGGTVLLALPAGILGAFLFYRTDLPLAGLLRFLTFLTLFVPLPLFATAWQATLGTGGWLPAALWGTAPFTEAGAGEVRPLWKPWAQGLGAAAWVHAVAALPWVILIVGQGLRWVERELEEDALTAAGPWRVVWHVTLPRCQAALGVAAVWVALMAATEITIADMMQVRTLAEEVYLQFGLQDDEGVSRTVLVSLPALLVVGALVFMAVRRWERTVPPLEQVALAPRQYRLGFLRWPCFVVVLTATASLVAVPVGSLIWKAGLGGSPESWSVSVLGAYLDKIVRTGSVTVVASCAVAAGAGLLAAALGLVVCWLAQDSRPFRQCVLVVLATAWVLPAPVIGVGLKETIQRLLDLEDWLWGGLLEPNARPLRQLLFLGPSAAPILWAYLVRFLPFAIALQWPVVRHIPPELCDAIRTDGATGWQEFRHLIVPLAWPACWRAGLAAGVLALGEIGTSKLVWAGWHPFAHEVFAQMHYGVTNSLAALCLVLLGVAAAGGTVAAGLRR